LGIARVADQEMIRALRVVTVERGVDPREYALLAFGGAGPMHALRLAGELGISLVLCPRAAGVLSALGLVASDRRRDLARSVLLAESAIRAGDAEAAVAALAARAREQLPGARIEVLYDLRYRGQSFELSVEGGERTDTAALRDAFEREHERRYGYLDPRGELELVSVRVAAVGERRSPALETGERATAPTVGQRRARFEDGWAEATVLRGELRLGDELEGPAICELPEATVVVPPGWSGSVDRHGTLALRSAA
jgi:N-methylhydantoinase A